MQPFSSGIQNCAPQEYFYFLIALLKKTGRIGFLSLYVANKKKLPLALNISTRGSREVGINELRC